MAEGGTRRCGNYSRGDWKRCWQSCGRASRVTSCRYLHLARYRSNCTKVPHFRLQDLMAPERLTAVWKPFEFPKPKTESVQLPFQNSHRLVFYYCNEVTKAEYFLKKIDLLNSQFWKFKGMLPALVWLWWGPHGAWHHNGRTAWWLMARREGAECFLLLFLFLIPIFSWEQSRVPWELHQFFQRPAPSPTWILLTQPHFLKLLPPRTLCQWGPSFPHMRPRQTHTHHSQTVAPHIPLLPNPVNFSPFEISPC